MTRDPEKFLFDILDSGRFLIEFTANEGPERFRNDRAYRAAVERELQIIGEAMMQLKAVRADLTDGIAMSWFMASTRWMRIRSVQC